MLTRLLERLVSLGPLELAAPVLRRRQLIAESDALLSTVLPELPDPHDRNDHDE
jgi:hypothetical protein